MPRVIPDTVRLKILKPIHNITAGLAFAFGPAQHVDVSAKASHSALSQISSAEDSILSAEAGRHGFHGLIEMVPV